MSRAPPLSAGISSFNSSSHSQCSSSGSDSTGIGTNRPPSVTSSPSGFSSPDSRGHSDISSGFLAIGPVVATRINSSESREKAARQRWSERTGSSKAKIDPSKVQQGGSRDGTGVVATSDNTVRTIGEYDAEAATSLVLGLSCTTDDSGIGQTGKGGEGGLHKELRRQTSPGSASDEERKRGLREKEGLDEPSRPSSSSPSTASKAGAVAPLPSTATSTFTGGSSDPSTTTITINSAGRQRRQLDGEIPAQGPSTRGIPATRTSDLTEARQQAPISAGRDAGQRTSGLRSSEEASGSIKPSGSTGIWGRFYSGLTASFSTRGRGSAESNTKTHFPKDTTDAKEDSPSRVERQKQPTIVVSLSADPTPVPESDGVTRSATDTLPSPVTPGNNWSRTASVGSIQGLLTSALDYIVSVSRSASLAGLPIAGLESTSPPLLSQSPTNDTENIVPTTNTPSLALTLPSPSKPRRGDSRPVRPRTPEPPPSSAGASIASGSVSRSLSLSYSLSTRLHAAYQAVLAPSSSTTTAPPTQTIFPTHPHYNGSQAQVTSSSPPPGRPRRNKEDLDALLSGQQKSGAAMYRRNTVNTSPNKAASGSGGSGSANVGSSGTRRDKYTDYFKDREATTSPPPLPVPPPGMSQSYHQPSSMSRSGTPHGGYPSNATTATTASTGTSSRRNTIDSVAASFSSFYTSATSVAGSSTTRDKDRDREYRRASDKERSSSRAGHRTPARAMSPDPTQVNTVINSYSPPEGSSDPYAAIRLEDRCRHLEKTVKELQSRLRSKELEVKNREGEVRAKDVELRAKDAEVRQKDGEMREKENEARKREGDLRDREGELREVEGLLREMEGEVRWRDEEIEKLKARDLQWQRAVQKMDAERKAERELANRKSMKELVNQTKENAEKLERELKRRASAAPVVAGNKRPGRGRGNSVSIDGEPGVPGEDEAKTSTSAPSAAHLANGYQASKRQKQEPSESSSSVSSSAATTETEESNEHSPGTSLSASPASPPQQPQARPSRQPSALVIAAAKSHPRAPPPPPILPYTEAHAQQRSADEFLTRTDSWSGAQVLQAVNDINSEVVQFAAVVTEMCRFAPREVPSPSPSPTPYSVPGGSGSRSRAQDNNGDMNQLKGTKPYADTAARLGGALTHLLATYDHSNDPILVQLALQACVCIAAKRAWESFCLGLPAKSDGVLGAIYRSLRELEPQPTSSKWRSLTHGHIHAIYPSLAAYSANELGETMLRWTLDILTLAGCVGIESSASTPTNANPPPNPGSLASYGLTVNTNPPSAVLRTQRTATLILPKLLHITTALTRLENVLRQDILSTTFDLVIPECGMSFGKEWMVDFFGFTAKEAPNGGGGSHSDRREDNKVLGSVEVGLMCRTRVGMHGGGSTPTVANGGGMGSILGGQGTNMSQQQQGGASGAVYEERLLLMPKVILESMVDLL
ncbi:hypothetical protein D9611_001807 [Ephemerocybe angulata]|uniref:Uncharacterized protein n=1 Tax=Ephemerocybe angulata TaxID=980116 RepID=A0A8H5CKM1_9AGAR|nr:hypothetical protein D9611_001807 [Tulosesus angulatus]